VSIILNIDTAVQISSICLAENGKPLAVKINPSQKDAASWLHVAIKELSAEINFELSQADAISVSEGPGSYTGLRVGMSTAKGLCYALNKPLITINTLQMMAFSAREYCKGFLCPMIDARRMEVFTAVFDQNLQTVLPYTNMTLNENSFDELLQKNTITFFGNGSIKFQQIMQNPQAVFASVETDASSMAELSHNKFSGQELTNLAYSQPFYGKDFYSSVKKSL
jgi:tRNA threonylcarbamoyladenosine biosynthesis protein TsaB